MLFTVKVKTKHPDNGCSKTCKLDVIADDWATAGQKAIELIKPQGPHWLSVQKAGGK